MVSGIAANRGVPMQGNKAQLAGKVCLVSGATGGIGLETARGLAARGATVLCIGRDRARGETVAASLADVGGSGVYLPADLSNQADIRTLAKTVTDSWPRLDVLVNNAGGMFGRRTLSADGIEMTFALNHLGYVLLTELLLPASKAAGRGRIVNVASTAYRGARLDFDNLQGERRYDGLGAYRLSKLCNILFTYALAKRLVGTGVTVNALHPGFCATDIGVRNRWTPGLVWRLLCLTAISAEEGAQTSIHLAAAPEVADVTGKYFVKCRPERSSPESYDEDAAERLMAVSTRLIGA